ncbi:hypothetical protein KJI95_06850 [Shewanella sp. JM162201]|uniref:Porin domain-containing protein n=1 Tax=Shewanella jiangmenensis TaxID=2837387 RepID=A0ABS5V347_9GAMM|nr:hypothetical protein [Shewanella jiangmenensis]MBT1444242.1 hypothetical protein [Shewanella jiangmenensis]
MRKSAMVALLGLLSAAPAMAQQDIRFSGFGSIGALYHDSDYLGFHRDYTMEAVELGWSTAADTMLGLQLNADLTDQLDLVGQMVFKNRVSDEVSDNLEWLFLRYRPNSDWAFRVGRLGLDLYMLSEYRDVSYAYSWVRPVPEFYNLISSISRYNGADVSYRTRLGDNIFEAKLAYGSNDAALQGAEQQIDIGLDDITALTLSLTANEWLLRASIANASATGENYQTNQLLFALRSIPKELWPDAAALADEIAFIHRKSRYYALGAQYDDGRWILQSELGYTETDWRLLQPYMSGYISLGRRFDNLTLFAMVASVQNTEDAEEIATPPSLPFLPAEQQAQLLALHGAAQYSYHASSLDQTSYSLGARWDFYDNMALKFQWDHTQIGDYGSSLWVRDFPMAHDDSVNVFSINLSFTF